MGSFGGQCGQDSHRAREEQNNHRAREEQNNHRAREEQNKNRAREEQNKNRAREEQNKNRTDAELLAAHVAGDRYAFEELFFRHHRQLYRLARMTSRNPDDAADALQDAMLSAHRRAPMFRHDAAVSSWLYRIVVNACLDRLRRNKTHSTTALIDEACHVGDPTARVDTAIVIERALKRLPVEQRAAVVAVDMQGYSIAETARMLGIPEGTVKSRCSRARAKLAEALDHSR